MLVNFLEPVIFQNYKRLNIDLASSLPRTKKPVSAVITFASPVGVDDARVLAEQSGLVVLSYGAVGTNASRQRVSVYRWPDTQTVEELPSLEGIRLDGIMTITGLVKAGEAGLGTLVSDERVALVDVTANQIKERVEAQLAEPIDLTQIGAPNPSWFIAAGVIDAP